MSLHSGAIWAFSGWRFWLKPDMCFLLKTLCTACKHSLKKSGGYHVTVSTVEVPIHLISTEAFNSQSLHVSGWETVFAVLYGCFILIITRFIEIIQQCIFHLLTVILLKPHPYITCYHGNTPRSCSERWRMIVPSVLECIQTRVLSLAHMRLTGAEFHLQKGGSGVGYLLLELAFLSLLPFWLGELSRGHDAGSCFLLPHTTAFAKSSYQNKMVGKETCETTNNVAPLSFLLRFKVKERMTPSKCLSQLLYRDKFIYFGLYTEFNDNKKMSNMMRLICFSQPVLWSEF